MREAGGSLTGASARSLARPPRYLACNCTNGLGAVGAAVDLRVIDRLPDADRKLWVALGPQMSRIS